MNGFLVDTNVISEILRRAPDVNATAVEHDLTLVTRNVKDFAGLGLAVINPWLET